MRAEVKSHQQANDALQQATGDRTALKEEVQELSQRLGSALDQIQKLTVDLATTRSLLDMQGRDRQAANAGASTSDTNNSKIKDTCTYQGEEDPPADRIPLWRMLGVHMHYPANMTICGRGSWMVETVMEGFQ